MDVHGWYFKVFVADRLKAYDAEVKRSLVRNDVAVPLALLLCTVLVRVMYQLDTPILRSKFLRQ